jgi:hypothetical protein
MANQFNFEGLNRWKNINQSKKKKTTNRMMIKSERKTPKNDKMF